MNQHITNFWRTITKNKPELGKAILALVIIIGLLLLFVNLADEVLERDTTTFDTKTLLAINARSTPFLNTVFVSGTTVAGKIGATIITLLVTIFFIVRHRYRKALFMVVAAAGAGIINLVMKLHFARQRPDLWQHLVSETSYSFPSGHAMISSAIAISVVILLWRTKYRILALIFAGVYVLFVGFSRLYLGVHYPTDILGGWLVSAIWVTLCWVIFYSSPGLFRRGSASNNK